MKLDVYMRRFEVNRSISMVWEGIRNLTGYYDSKISNIHKENEDTWYFTFCLKTGRFTRLMSGTLRGKAYSKEDNLTKIEIKSGSRISTIFTIVEFNALILISNLVSGIVISVAIKAVLIATIIFGFIFVCDRESKLNVNEFVKKMHSEGIVADKQISS